MTYTPSVPDEWISALSLEDIRAQLTYTLTLAESEKARAAQAETKAIGLQGELNEARAELANERAQRATLEELCNAQQETMRELWAQNETLTDTRAELAQARAELAQAMKPCTWTLEDDDSGTWEGSCRTAWTFIDDGPAENGLHFCPHCGHPVVIVDDDRPEVEE